MTSGTICEADAAPLVSICIPAYEQTKYLRHCLDSIVKQSFFDYEIVVTDDSRSDAVQELLSEFSFDSRLRYKRNPKRLGPPANWNYAISLARGEFIKIMHHDDHFVDECSLQHFIDLIQSEPDIDFAWSGSLITDDSLSLESVHSLSPLQFDEVWRGPETLFFDNVIGAPSATIFRSSRLWRYSDAYKWLVDVEFYIRAIRASRKVAYTEQAWILTPRAPGHQVTYECAGVAEVEVPEWVALYASVVESRSNRKFVARATQHLARQFARLNVTSATELRRLWASDAPHLGKALLLANTYRGTQSLKRALSLIGVKRWS